MANRLDLDFKISTSIERTNFINNYINEEIFKKDAPNEEELEMMANYMLWGLDEDGKNTTQRKEVEIPTRHSTWQKEQPESLEALTESPTFNDAIIRKPTKAVPRIPKPKFDRTEELKKCPDNLKPILLELFKRIDELDYAITMYEINHNKRNTPPREELFTRLTDDVRASMEELSKKWNQRNYLQSRHQLVELRREQYSLHDIYAEPIALQKRLLPEMPEEIIEIGIDIPVFPLGLLNDKNPLFFDCARLGPKSLTQTQLQNLSKKYWELQEQKTNQNFDFRDKEQVYQLLRHVVEAELDYDKDNLESSLSDFFRTLQFYIDKANLSPLLKMVLDMKMRRCKNPEICEKVNSTFGKSYTDNYISTIFRQQIIPRINAAADYHEREISSIFFPELFKQCRICKKYYLIGQTHFTKRTRAKDGFSSICKHCEKERRLMKVNK